MPRVKHTVKVLDVHGLHARPCTKIAESATRFNSDISLTNGSLTVNAKSVFDILMLASPHGTELDLIAEGPDAHDAVSTLDQLFASRFGIHCA